MMTAQGYILGLDLAIANFFTVQLPNEVQYNGTFKLSRAQHSGLYLIDVEGFQLRDWHWDGVGQWVLVDTICVHEACDHLKCAEMGTRSCTHNSCFGCCCRGQR
uniref:F-box protein AT5G49610-like beta-propeller domain-containing protein n=1 Tax=Arundo donax TaxID=35708 RepID=A0A0A8Y360_ARUDO